MLLGKSIPGVDLGGRRIIKKIERSEGRTDLHITRSMYGSDTWHAYELSWLDATGKPEVRVGRFTFPADSPCMVESKSFKLYLNSMNNHVFASAEEFSEQVKTDLGRVSQSNVELELFELEAPELSGAINLGLCLDNLEPLARGNTPQASVLEINPEEKVEEVLYSNLLRSLCPVTAQPDWATVRVYYRGAAISRASLLAYILSYRNHQEFHEQCVERMFSDLLAACDPEMLEIQGFYTRRGGLDINPFRTTQPEGTPLPRLNRQ
jgi:7-cyano-7-deazaguanine reductase